MSPHARSLTARTTLRHLTSVVVASTLAAGLCPAATAATAAPTAPTVGAAAGSTGLAVTDAHRPGADIGFHDWTRDGSARPLRNDLTGVLRGQVEFVQSSTVNPSGNAAAELPALVADRTALLLFSPEAVGTSESSPHRVEVRVKGQVKGTLTLTHPNLLPRADQDFDARGTVAYSRRAWSAQLPWQWVRPGLELTVTDATGRSGTLTGVDVAAPTEIVINNIQLGMLTTAPDSAGHRFIKDPANGATDYFQTLPVSRMVMAQYDKVELSEVIVASGAIYTPESPSPQDGGVYSGDMRENVGKAQVSTGINLATWGITSSPMNQSQPGITNQRVIHHSAGLYANGRQGHGLSGGNGMATLYDSVGNELSHELGHSYGLGHYPGTDNSKTGDDRIRNASHHMDSGWGWIAHRGLMRSNLDTGAYKAVRGINGYEFLENLAGRYNFNTDTMAGGWDASPVSDYTHATGYSQRRMQNSLRTLVADTSYPSGYRDWDAGAGSWVDAKVRTPSFDRPAPARVGVPVFTLLGGYNPANPAQTVLYPAFRSNYGTTFDLPQADPTVVGASRQCWLEIRYAAAPTQHVALDASNGVKQLNVNVAQSDRPTGAQVACRTDATTTLMGDPIAIATDLPAMRPAVVVGQSAGFEALRTQELAALQPVLEAQADATAPTLTSAQLVVLRGWSDDLSRLGAAARQVAMRILEGEDQAADLAAWLAEHADELDGPDGTRREELVDWLKELGHVDSSTGVLPTGTTVTVDGGKCLTLDEAEDGSTVVRTTTRAADCTGQESEQWWVDVAGRIHPTLRPDLCVRAQTPVVAVPCSTTDGEQRWVLDADGHVVRSVNTGSALDLYRSNHRPGLYGRTSGSNQIWQGFTRSGNALLANLAGNQLRALWRAWVPSVAVSPSVAAAASGWSRVATTARVTATDAFSSGPVTSEVDLGSGWKPYAGPVALPEGATTVKVRATSSRGARTMTTAIYRVDTVAPTSSARVDATHLHVSGGDASSGVATLDYRLDGGAWTAWTAPVRLPSGPRPRIEHRATDRAGNVAGAVALGEAEAVTLAVTVPRVVHGTAAAVRVRVRSAGDGVPAGQVSATTDEASTTGTILAAPVVDGIATLLLPATLPAGRSTWTFTHDGDARSVPGTVTRTVTVRKAASVTTAKVRAKASASRKVLVVRGKVRSTPGVDLTGTVRVRIVLKGRRAQVLTAQVSPTAAQIKKGVARVRVQVPRSMRKRRGVHAVRVRFLGTSDVKASRSPRVRITVS